MSIGKSSIARAAEAAAAPAAARSSNAAKTKTPAPKPQTLLTAVSPALLRPLAVTRGEASQELIRSVRKHGILVPLLAANVNGEYLVLLGEHRLAAARELGLAEVPVCVVEAEDEKAALRLMQEVRSARSHAPDSIQNEKFYAAAGVSDEELPVYLL
ncbi:MAG: ParB/RepB/Spo0J family partition protein [Firmicutes bacterium]|nr:ParB/RepB/Spo0J family partition protein [Bacillota bacterium]